MFLITRDASVCPRRRMGAITRCLSCLLVTIDERPDLLPTVHEVSAGSRSQGLTEVLSEGVATGWEGAQ